MQNPTQNIDTTNLMNGLGIDMGLIGTMMTVGTIVSIILALVFIFYVVKSGARRKKSEIVMIEMAKDIRDIKTLLEGQTAGTKPSTPLMEHLDGQAE